MKMNIWLEDRILFIRDLFITIYKDNVLTNCSNFVYMCIDEFI